MIRHQDKKETKLETKPEKPLEVRNREKSNGCAEDELRESRERESRDRESREREKEARDLFTDFHFNGDRSLPDNQ